MEVRDLLKQTTLFEDLSEDEIDILAQSTRIQTYRAGQVILTRLIHKPFSRRWSTPKSKLRDCHQVQDERFTSFALPCATQLRALRAGPMLPRRTNGLPWDHDHRSVTLDQSRRYID